MGTPQSAQMGLEGPLDKELCLDLESGPLEDIYTTHGTPGMRDQKEPRRGHLVGQNSQELGTWVPLKIIETPERFWTLRRPKSFSCPGSGLNSRAG